MKLRQLFLTAAILTMPLNISAATKKNNDRWFEVEVILFNQLGDKSALKEQFPETSQLPQYKRVIDLLGSYLNPDIVSIKQKLPLCNAIATSYNLNQYQTSLPPLFHEKSLGDIENSVIMDEFSYQQGTENAALDTELNQKNESALAQLAPSKSSIEAAQAKLAMQELVEAAEQAFEKTLPSYSNNADPRILCQIPEATFTEFQNLPANFDYYGFQVDKMPLRIRASGSTFVNQTHLLGDDALQLQDVVKDLRYSKNFKPLLHVGWRQVARAKNKAVAVKMYAGDNFEKHFQDQLAGFHKQQIENENNESTFDDLSSIDSATLTQQKIIQIIDNINAVPEDTDTLLTSLDQQQDTENNAVPNDSHTKKAPEAPIQPWFLDGFFNIHLKHYLFITADFNVLDKTLAQLSTEAISQEGVYNETLVAQAKPIRFKQNRRVISGEVHYFDHPYIGMIVQIRPYKKPKQEE